MTDTLTETPSENSRDQILDSAIKVFSQRGFGGTRLREIAEHASVSHAMIKYYFGNKEQLWRAAVDYLFERQSRELGPAFASARSSGETGEIRRVAIEQMIRYAARHPEHARLVMQASMTPGPHLDWILTHLRAIHGLYYAELGNNDALDNLDTNIIAMQYMMYGACHTIFTLEHEARGVYGIDVTSPDFIDRFVQLAIELLSVNSPAKLMSAENYADKISATLQNLPGIEVLHSEDALELRIVIPKSLVQK